MRIRLSDERLLLDLLAFMRASGYSLRASGCFAYHEAGPAGNTSAARAGSTTKDTVGPTLSVTYVGNKHPTADQVVVTTEPGATTSGSVHGNAFGGTGSFVASVGDVRSGSGTGSATATDPAGNTTTISFPWSAAK